MGSVLVFFNNTRDCHRMSRFLTVVDRNATSVSIRFVRRNYPADIVGRFDCAYTRSHITERKKTRKNYIIYYIILCYIVDKTKKKNS